MAEESQPPSAAASDQQAPKLWRAVTFTLIGTFLLIVALVLLALWLLAFPRLQQDEVLTVRSLRDILTLAFAAVAGIGGVVALVVAYQRQRLAERTQRHAEHIQRHAEQVAQDLKEDATERRVTELYTQAVEQLGHDKAAVRLGGLYALDRLGNNHPEHRQTITDVICAYLRMPFTPPPEAPQQPEQPNVEESPEPSPTATAKDRTSEDDVDAQRRREELQVRLTAQRLLQHHLIRPAPDQPVPSTFWDKIRIDLNGARLINIDFTGAHFTRTAGFRGATFSGDAWFEDATFSSTAGFEGAVFSGTAGFRDAMFSGTAGFEGAVFSGTGTVLKIVWVGW